MTSFESKVLTEIDKAESGDEHAKQHAAKLRRALNDFFRVREYAKGERKRVSDNVKEQFEYLKDAHEEPVATPADPSTATPEEQRAAFAKARRLEVCWQDYEEARAEAKDVRGAMRDAIKGAEDRVRVILDEANQLSLFTEPVGDDE